MSARRTSCSRGHTPASVHVLADLPVELVGRLRSDRVMLRDAGPRRPTPRGGQPRKHGGVLTFSKPTTQMAPDRRMPVRGHLTTVRLCRPVYCVSRRSRPTGGWRRGRPWARRPSCHPGRAC
ncbi:transposase [Streptomyces sp. NPDC057582]|uniref:transposase n=1 Tax=Streptomyces sp. NPDC057582 TaxID=3346174 RepID=UPI0036C6CD48